MLAILSILLKLPVWTTRVLLLLIGIAMLIGAGIGVYHAGVEWHFWEGPATCATTAQGVSSNVGDLLGDLDSKHGAVLHGCGAARARACPLPAGTSSPA